MGEVWAATRESDMQQVAIKVLLARAAMKPDLVRRFDREAKIASAIKSPYVCQLLEVNEADDGAHLLVFEQLDGESLADRLKREQYLPFSEVGPIIDDVLQGLVAAHAAGVIHRDLKPGNIYLEHLGLPDRRERAKILDFGISKLTRREKEEPTLTAFDATLGSFAYMAPEQVRGAARADERADIYAVGAVAFRALSGRLPFEGATAAVLVAMKLDRAAPSLAEATGEKWPVGIERFLERALDRRRERRFSTAGEALTSWRAIQPANITRAARRAQRSRLPSELPDEFLEDNPTVVDGPPTMTENGGFADTGQSAPPPAPSSRTGGSAPSSRSGAVPPPPPSRTGGSAPSSRSGAVPAAPPSRSGAVPAAPPSRSGAVPPPPPPSRSGGAEIPRPEGPPSRRKTERN